MHKQKGFTLLEMLVATVIAALLMTGVLTVTASVAGSYRAMRDSDSAELLESLQPGLMELIRQDLQHARTIEQNSRGPVITGLGSLDVRTCEPTHGAARVEYFTTFIGKRSWLVRRQTDLTGGDRSWTQAICPDIYGVVFRPEGIVSSKSSSSAPRPALPTSVHVTLMRSGSIIEERTFWFR